MVHAVHADSMDTLAQFVDQEVDLAFLDDMLPEADMVIISAVTATVDPCIEIRTSTIEFVISAHTKGDERFIGKEDVDLTKLSKAALLEIIGVLGDELDSQPTAPVVKTTVAPAVKITTLGEAFVLLGLDKSLSDAMKAWLKLENRWGNMVLKTTDSGMKIQVNWANGAQRAKMYGILAQAAKDTGHACKTQTRHIWIGW